MCIELPCGYSTQTLTKVIAYCEIGRGLQIMKDLDHSFNLFQWVAFLECLILVELAAIAMFQSMFSAFTHAINFVAMALCMMFAMILEARPGSLRDVTNENPKDHPEINVLLELPHEVQTCFILWIFVNLITSMVLGIVLLQGAQERNLGKVRIWFILTIICYILWLPIFMAWSIHSSQAVNIIFLTLMNYLFGGLSLYIIHTFMEELRIENITHRPGYKTHHIAFDKI